MKIKPITAALALAGIFAAAYSLPASAQAANTSLPVTRVVDAGDTLSGIAAEYQTTYVRLYEANPQINDPNIIKIGEDLRIPAADEQLPGRALPVAAHPVVAKQIAASPPVIGGDVWDRLAQCEASGNWTINTGNGYYGGLQFALASWKAAGGTGYPHQASKAEQIAAGERLLARQGWNAWPACSAELGLR